jgi:hypothetical protein
MRSWLSDVTDCLGRAWHHKCALLELAEQRHGVRR